MNIWNSLPKPFFILAPMEDVTDSVFRRVFLKSGAPDLFFTEFTSVDGLKSPGHDKVAQRLLFHKEEKPLIAQVWGMRPENYLKTAQELREKGFDGIDINMGCPQKTVVKNGACSALIKNRPLAHEIIEATKEGAGDMPVSVKTRIGFKTIETEDWLGFLLEHNLSALTVHGRTQKEMSKVPAHWDQIRIARELRDKMGKNTKIIGNGDVLTMIDAKKKAKDTGVDGVMIGRGALQNPWVFAGREHEGVSVTERLGLMRLHLDLFEEEWSGIKSYQLLKKYFKVYLSNFDGAAEMRQECMLTEDYDQARELLGRYAKMHIDK